MKHMGPRLFKAASIGGAAGIGFGLVLMLAAWIGRITGFPIHLPWLVNIGPICLLVLCGYRDFRSFREVVFFYAVFYGIVGVLCGFAWWRCAVSKRQGPGICGKCQYDLTGNVSGVCPECGTPVPKASAGKRDRFDY